MSEMYFTSKTELIWVFIWCLNIVDDIEVRINILTTVANGAFSQLKHPADLGLKVNAVWVWRQKEVGFIASMASWEY